MSVIPCDPIIFPPEPVGSATDCGEAFIGYGDNSRWLSIKKGWSSRTHDPPHGTRIHIRQGLSSCKVQFENPPPASVRIFLVCGPDYQWIARNISYPTTACILGNFDGGFSTSLLLVGNNIGWPTITMKHRDDLWLPGWGGGSYLITHCTSPQMTVHLAGTVTNPITPR